MIKQINYAICGSVLIGSICCQLSLAAGNHDLVKNIALELVDWTVSEVCLLKVSNVWLRIKNFNARPIVRIKLAFDALDNEGTVLNHGTFTIEDVIAAEKAKNFVDLPLGVFDPRVAKLNVQIVDVASEEAHENFLLGAKEFLHLLFCEFLVLLVSGAAIILNDRRKQ